MMTSSDSIVTRLLFGVILLSAALFGSEIRFDGNDLFSRRELEGQMSLPENFHQLDKNKQEYFIEVGKLHIKQLYDNKGFFSAKVPCYQVYENSSPFWLCQIEEGPQWTIGELIYTSEEHELLAHRPAPKIKYGSPFRNKDLAEEIERFGEAFRDLGYIHLRTDYRLIPDTANHIIDVEIRLIPGVQVRMGDFLPELKRSVTPSSPQGGSGLTDPDYLRSLWLIEPGENVTGKEFHLYRRKLLQTGLFRQVQLKDSLREDGQSDIRLLTVEKQPGTWINRVFWDPLYLGPGMETQVKYKNFLGKFHEGSVGALMSENRQRLALGYAHPLPFGSVFRFDDKLSYTQEELPILNYPDSLEKRYEFRNRSTVSKRFSPAVRGLFSADVRRITLYSGDQSAPDSLERSSYNKFNLEPVLDLQFTDDWLEPTKGWRARLTLLNGGRINNRFNSVQLETGFYFPLGSRIYWAVAADGGKFFNSGDRDDAKTFYQGGFRSVRGYGERTIFPSRTESELDSEGNPTDVVRPGLTPQYLRLSNEFRINMPEAIRRVQLVQFTDWAYVADADPAYSSGEEMGAGVGLRYRLPFLTLRLDYTLKKNFRDLLEGEPFSWSRFSLDLSQAI